MADDEVVVEIEEPLINQMEQKRAKGLHFSQRLLLPDWIVGAVLFGCLVATLMCLSCFCYYAFCRKLPQQLRDRRGLYIDEEGPVDVDMIHFQRKSPPDGTCSGDEYGAY